MEVKQFLEQYKDTVSTGYWIVDDNGVYQTKTGDSMTSRRVASPIPIIPTAILDNVDSGVEKLELAFYKFRRWKTVIVDRQTIASRNKIVSLADKGIEVNSNNAPTLVSYIADAISYSLGTITHKSAKSVLGWNENDFLPYTGDMVFDGEDTYRYLYRAVRSKGTLDEWVKTVSKLREKIENRLFMAGSFASPIIELVGENPFCVELFGQTGTAKTVALMAAASIWGDPSLGQLVRTLNMTANAMLSTAAFLRNLPFCGDELQTIKSKFGTYDNLIMQVTEGIDRGRMTYDKINEVKSWKCSFLFTGEENIVKSGSGGGVKNRVIVIETQRPLCDDGNATANSLRNSYGTAAVPYLAELKRRDLITEYRAIYDTIITKCDTTDKQAGAMALMVLADRVATELFFPNEKPLDIPDIEPYLCSAKDVDVTERAYQYICDTFGEASNNFSSDAKTVWGVFDSTDSKRIYVNRNVLERELQKGGFDFDACRKKWIENGYIVKSDDDRLRHKKRINGITTSCILLKLPKEDVRKSVKYDSDQTQFETVAENETLEDVLNNGEQNHI